jgi:hypothetical protein
VTAAWLTSGCATALAAASLAACGSSGHAAATSAANAGTGDTAPRCASSGADVPRSGVQLREGTSTLGVVLLRKSRACDSAWGVVLGLPGDARVELTSALRPGGPRKQLVATGPYTRAGVSGREVVDRHGCVVAEATVLRGGRVVAHAETPCG